MANIIDFEFYRKFRIILPVRPNSRSLKPSSVSSRSATKQYRRRRKSEFLPPTKKENDS